MKSEQMSISKANYEKLIEAKQWLDDQYISLTQRIRELENYNQELLTAQKWLEEQNQMKTDRINELEKWCEDLEKGKEWLEKKWKEAIEKE